MADWGHAWPGMFQGTRQRCCSAGKCQKKPQWCLNGWIWARNKPAEHLVLHKKWWVLGKKTTFKPTPGMFWGIDGYSKVIDTFCCENCLHFGRFSNYKLAWSHLHVEINLDYSRFMNWGHSCNVREPWTGGVFHQIRTEICLAVEKAHNYTRWWVYIPSLKYNCGPPKMGVPQNGWFILKTSYLNGWFGRDPIWGNLQLNRSQNRRCNERWAW